MLSTFRWRAQLLFAGAVILNSSYFSSSLHAQVGISSSLTAPIVDGGDIAFLPGTGIDDLENISGPGIGDSSGNDASTYLAHDRASVGQTFTTGANPNGYQLNSITIQNVQWENFLGNGTYYGVSEGDLFKLQMGSISGTTKTMLFDTAAALYSGAGINGGGDSGTGTYFTFDLSSESVPTLQPNTSYYFELAAESNPLYFELNGVDDSVTEFGNYAGGTAFVGSTTATIDSSFNAVAGDRAFHVDLDLPGESFTLFVNTDTGAVSLKNEMSASLSFAYYLVQSAGGALNTTSWDSLADQSISGTLAADFNADENVDGADLSQWESGYGVDASGDADSDSDTDGADFLTWQRQLGESAGGSWIEAGLSDSAHLSELNLNSQTTLAPGEELSLGDAFDLSVFGSGNEGDLLFEYRTAEAGSLSLGKVVYVSSEQLAQAAGAAQSVPEPTAMLLIVSAIALLLNTRKQNRR